MTERVALDARDATPKQRASVWIAWALIGLALVLWHLHFGFIYFKGMDGGVLISTAWQQYQGAVAYRDFYTATPPLFVLGAGWAFKLLGPTWLSLIILVCVFSSITYLWMFVLLWKMTGRAWSSLAFSLAIQCLTFVPTSWWWYNSMTAALGAIFLASVCALVIRPTDIPVRCSFFAAEALLGLSKPNTAGVLLALCFLFLLFHQRLRLFALGATVAAALADVAFLALNHISLGVLIQNYLDCSASRVTSVLMWITNAWYFYVYYEKRGSLLILAFLSTALAVRIVLGDWPNWRQQVQAAALWFIAAGAMVVGIGTNNDRKAEEAVYLVVLVPFLAHQLAGSPRHRGWRLEAFAHALILTMCVVSFWWGYSRRVFFEINVTAYAVEGPLVTLTEPPLFRSLQTSIVLPETIHDIGDALRENGAFTGPPQKIFFGPLLDFAPAAFNLPQERNLPVWWEKVPSSHRGEDYPSGTDMPTYMADPSRWIGPGEPLDFRVQHFLNAKFDLCFFYIGWKGLPEMDYMPADIRAEMYENYQVEYRGHVAVFKRKK